MRSLFPICLALFAITTSCKTTPSNTRANTNTPQTAITEEPGIDFPDIINIENVAQNPEGIEFNKNSNTFLLSSLNATPIISVSLDGAVTPFTSGEPYPMSTAGLQIDYQRNRLLVACFNGMELFDNDPETKGVSNLRVYNLETGKMEKDINLSALFPDANAYFANDIAVDNDGNAYISDWYAGVVYKVDVAGTPSIFWKNETEIPSGPNGLDFHPEGYLLVSILNVNDKGLYADYGLLNISITNPEEVKIVEFVNAGFTGFDGMVVSPSGNVIGVTNNGESPGGNTLIELVGQNGWESAKVVNSAAIAASTTVALTADGKNYVINQDFTNSTPENWTIGRVEF